MTDRVLRDNGQVKRKFVGNGVDPLGDDALSPAHFNELANGRTVNRDIPPTCCTHLSTHSESSTFTSHTVDDSPLTSTLHSHISTN